MSSRRLSPKEIKHDIREDELSTSVTSAVDWIGQHLRAVVIGVVALVAVAILGAIAAAVLADRRDAAAAELAELIEIYQANVEGGATPELASPTDLRFADEATRVTAAREKAESIGGPGTGAASEIAELYLADLAVAEGNADRAREIWQSYLAGHDEGVLAASVKLNLLRLDRQEGRAAEVAEALRSDLESLRGPLPEDALLFELAATLEQLDQEEEASEIYQRLVDEHPQSPFASRARQRTAEAA